MYNIADGNLSNARKFFVKLTRQHLLIVVFAFINATARQFPEISVTLVQHEQAVVTRDNTLNTNLECRHFVHFANL